MAVMIKGMEMPEECRECPLEMYYINTGETRCRATNTVLASNYETIKFEGRAKDCPIEETPEQKRGRWIYGEDDVAMRDGYHCSECGFFVLWAYKHCFCPQCGAKMEEMDELER